VGTKKRGGTPSKLRRRYGKNPSKTKEKEKLKSKEENGKRVVLVVFGKFFCGG